MTGKVYNNQLKESNRALSFLLIKQGRKVFLQSTKTLYFCCGEMAEWSIAAVLKTVGCNSPGGSNPSLSAKSKSLA